MPLDDEFYIQDALRCAAHSTDLLEDECDFYDLRPDCTRDIDPAPHSLGLVLPERLTSGLHLRRLQRRRLERLYQLLNRAGSPCRIVHNHITIR